MALEVQQAKVCDGRVEKIISFRIGEFMYCIKYVISSYLANIHGGCM